MAEFRIFRETSLPATMQPRSVYLVAPTTSTDYVEMYVTDATGANARRIIKESDVTTMIANAMSGSSSITVLADIAARDALSPTGTQYVYVRNASADTTVTAGGATYLYDVANTTWVKISEAESLDVSLDWASLTGKPTSTAAQIDGAVTASHTHANKTDLDAIGKDADNNLTFNGTRPTIAWTSTGW